MIDPSGKTIWTTSDPGSPVSIPTNPLSNGTAHTLTGDDLVVSTIAWKNQSQAFYTSSSYGGYGHFGTVDLTTFKTTCVKNSTTGVCLVFPSAHGMTYDPFTNTIIIFGATQITQIDPATLGIISTLNVPGMIFDQGTVDAKGHLFVASNSGVLFFLDYSLSGLVNASANFSVQRQLIGDLDDVAPLIGSGSSIG
jgi:hypothetical protein